MSKCKRNILLIFGYLLIMVLLFVPYSSKIINDLGYGAKTIKIVDGYGYLFLPFCFVRKARINFELLSTEIAAIIFVGGFAYILFCVVLRKEKKRNK